MIKSVYGKDALARLDEDEEDIEEEGNTTCTVEIRPVQLIELNELIIGALNEKSYRYAREGK